VSEVFGAYELEPVAHEVDGFTWHAARRSDGAWPALWAKMATTEETAQALAREARLTARLSEHTAAVPRPVDHVREGDRHALLMVALAGEPLGEGPIGLGPALAVADALAELDHTLAYQGLWYQPRREDLRVAAGGKGVWVTGLHRLQPALGVDAHDGTRAWGALIAGLLGIDETGNGAGLEAVSRQIPPRVLDMLRAAFEGRGYPLELLEDLEGEADAPPSLALRARRAASFGLGETVLGPQGPLYLSCRDGDDWLALDPRLDAVVRLVGDREGWATTPPEPVVLAPSPPPGLGDPEPPPRLVLRRRPEGTVLQLSDLALHTDAVLLVRRRSEGPILVPEDGEVLVTLEGHTLEEPYVDADAASGDRYAAFPLFGDVPGPPGRARN
jgi:hypothetical protein